MVPTAAINTLLQTISPDHIRGRVMSLFFIMFMGCQTLGSLLAGFLAPVVGAPITVGLTGVCCLGVAVFAKLQLPMLERREAE
jgi:MFS family permease